jgi:hypothetical protein
MGVSSGRLLVDGEEVRDVMIRQGGTVDSVPAVVPKPTGART